MRKAAILHNPEAGNGDLSKDELKTLLKENGFECTYASTKKKDWDKIKDSIDIIIIAGGDGTVRKVVKKLLKRSLMDKKLPIIVLPGGTANNIAKTLYPIADIASILENLFNNKRRKLDIGKLEGIENEMFLLEALGLGVFPQLMKEIKQIDQREELTPEEELELALKMLMEITRNYEPKYCSLTIDGNDFSGKYILIEVMNIQSVGPNLLLAPDADPGDSFFDVVLISEEEKEKFINYLFSKIRGAETSFNFHTVKAKKISLKWGGTHAHIDDELVKTKKNQELTIEIQEKVLEYF